MPRIFRNLETLSVYVSVPPWGGDQFKMGSDMVLAIRTLLALEVASVMSLHCTTLYAQPVVISDGVSCQHFSKELRVVWPILSVLVSGQLALGMLVGYLDG